MVRCPDCESCNTSYHRKGESANVEIFMCYDCFTKFAVEVVDGEKKVMEYYDECDTQTHRAY